VARRAESLAQRARAATLHARLGELVREARGPGLGPTDLEIVLFAAVGPGDDADALPHPTRPQLVLCLDRLEHPVALDLAVLRGLVLLARWQSRALPMPTPWDRVSALRTVPLAEGVYAEGLAHHLMAALHPELPPHRRLGIARASWDLLRQRESVLLDALERDLPRPGLGPWTRWLDPAPPVPDGPDSARPPRGAIGYLAWRLLEDRVRRVGLAEAAEMEA
jgi:hypothetical protein